MKNIPIFTAAGGTATLILREIPKTKRAYVLLQTHTPGMEEQQIRECAAFCRMAGAAEVYVTSADKSPLLLPHSHDMLRLTLERARLMPPERDITLCPLTDDTEALYIEYYNQRFSPILNAAMCDSRSLARAAADGTQHFLALHGDIPVGLGAIREASLEAVAAIQSGWGSDVTKALLAQTTGDPILLTVCSANHRAVQLYQRLGFTRSELVSRWWKAL